MKRGFRVILFCQVRFHLPHRSFPLFTVGTETEIVRTGDGFLYSEQILSELTFIQAMKVIRTDLTAEGRLDVLEKVMAYRGGLSNGPSVATLALTQGVPRIFTSGKSL